MPASLDWRFVSNEYAMTAPDFRMHAGYPMAQNPTDLGYYRDNVPDVDTCISVDINSTICTDTIIEKTYIGILLGDVDGSWQTAVHSPIAKTSEFAYNYKVVFDWKNATSVSDSVYRLPVYVESDTLLRAIDFKIDYDQELFTVVGVEKNPAAGQISMASNDYQQDHFLLTSFTMQPTGFPTGMPIYYISFKAKAAQELDGKLFVAAYSYLNGQPAEPIFDGSTPTVRRNIAAAQLALTAYPNPTDNVLTLELNSPQAEEARVTVVDLMGRTLATQNWDLAAGVQRYEMDLKAYGSGIYFVKVETSAGFSTLRVVKN